VRAKFNAEAAEMLERRRFARVTGHHQHLDRHLGGTADNLALLFSRSQGGGLIFFPVPCGKRT